MSQYLELLTAQVCALSTKVGQFIREQRGKLKTTDIEEKGLHDLVSYVDKTAERYIIEGLKPLLPEAGFIAEESGGEQAEAYNWIIDPLDGTTNFVHGIPVFSISIALQHYRKTILGVVHEINMDECFSAWDGGGAFLNGKPICVTENKKLAQCLIATGFPYSDFSRMAGYKESFDVLMRQTRGIRRLGSAAVDLAYVACGRFDVFYEYSLQPWDVAAGAFIVQEAGGRISGFDGSSEVVFGRDILATNGHVHDQMLAITNKYLVDYQH